MGDLYEYTDYRALLRDWFNDAKSRSVAMSYRYLAGRLDMDPGFLVHIMQGEKHLSEKHIPALAKVMALGKRESGYFERLVLFNKARGDREIARRYLELMELRSTHTRKLSSQQYQYYGHWYIPVVRCVIAARGFHGDYSALAAQLDPPIQAAEAEQAVRLLKSLKMIRKAKDGSYDVVDSHVTTGDSWMSHAIQEFQSQVIALAGEALRRIPKPQREISSMTLAIPTDQMSTVQDMVRDFRQRLARWALDQADADHVVQLNIQVFPVVKQ